MWVLCFECMNFWQNEDYCLFCGEGAQEDETYIPRLVFMSNLPRVWSKESIKARRLGKQVTWKGGLAPKTKKGEPAPKKKKGGLAPNQQKGKPAPKKPKGGSALKKKNEKPAPTKREM